MPRNRQPQLLRDDADLCKVKVRPRSASRSRSQSRARLGKHENRSTSRQPRHETNQYLISGGGKNVVLQFTQKNQFGGMKTTRNTRGRENNRYVHKGTRGKKLGQTVGMDEFKKRALEVKNGKGAKKNIGSSDPVDDDLAREIEDLRQLKNDEDVGFLDVEEEKEGNGDKDAGWFSLDNSKGADFFKSFLGDVKCTAYITDKTCVERNACNNNTACVEKNACSPSSTDQEVAVEEEREDGNNAIVERIEDYNFEDRDLQEELREMEQYKAQQKDFKMFMKEEIENMAREEAEMKQNREIEEARRKQEALEELERMKREEDAMKKEQEDEEMHQQLEAMEMERVMRDVEEMKEMQQSQNAKNKSNIDHKRSSVTQEKLSEHSPRNSEKDMKEKTEAEKDIDNSKKKGTNWFESWASNVLRCGEDMEVLDMLDWSNKNKRTNDHDGRISLHTEKKHHVDDHQDNPPTALYAAIGTQNWNIAIRRLMDKPKEASTWVNNASLDGESVFRFLPLHIACLSGAPLLLVTLLLQTYPNAAKYSAMDKLPIHMACETLADHRIIFLLLNAWPDCINIKDGDGNTPIEIASFHDSCEERKQIVQVLTKKMECTVVKTPTPLYAAVDSQHWNSAIKRLVQMPQEATVWVSFTKKSKEVRFLPLHIACHLGAPYFLISDLVHAYPDAVRKKTTGGKLPLHIACEHHDDERVVKLLLNFWPESLLVKDDEGNTAIDIVQAAEFSPERTAIIILLQKKLEHQDKVVFSPTELYSMIEEKQWDAAVRKCLESQDQVSTWVGLCKKKADAKLLPLHLACSSRAPLILVAVLIQSYTESVKRCNNVGKLPIHLACENRADHRVVSLLLHTFPDSYKRKDEKGNTPVQSALLASPSPERTKIVETLMTFEAKGGDNQVRDPNMIMDLLSQEQIQQNGMVDEKIGTFPATIVKNSKRKSKMKSRRARKNDQNPWGKSENMFS